MVTRARSQTRCFDGHHTAHAVPLPLSLRCPPPPPSTSPRRAIRSPRLGTQMCSRRSRITLLSPIRWVRIRRERRNETQTERGRPVCRSARSLSARPLSGLSPRHRAVSVCVCRWLQSPGFDPEWETNGLQDSQLKQTQTSVTDGSDKCCRQRPFVSAQHRRGLGSSFSSCDSSLLCMFVGVCSEAVDLLVQWALAQKLPGLKLEVLREKGRTPLIFIEVRPTTHSHHADHAPPALESKSNVHAAVKPPRAPNGRIGALTVPLC